jgi:glutamate--cysteine ligase
MRTEIVTELEKLLQTRGTDISRWFERAFAQHPAPFYSSVDIRHSGFKIVPVDTNLFPAGFNNLSPAARERASISFKRRLQSEFPFAKKLLILAENHTRNKGYLENLAVLSQLLSQAGAEVIIGRAEGDAPLLLETSSGQSLTEYPLTRRAGALITTDGFQPDLIIINNDMSAGVPEILENISQPLIPSPHIGWHRRRKSRHFALYGKTVQQFAQDFGFDCWKIWTAFEQRENLDFKTRQGMDEIGEAVESVLHSIARKYEAYGIEEEPYVYVKADAGTYGMGITTVRGPEEIAEMNKKLRNKMQVIKEGAKNSRVIIQEGVPTADNVKGAPAEPMIYLVDGQPVGGAFRVNPERDIYRNLNAKGMYFTGMCDQAEDGTLGQVAVARCNYKVYGLIARLASLAAAQEANE